MFEGGAAGGPKARALRKELGDLERAEAALDELIQSSSAQLKHLTEHKDSQRYPLHPRLPLFRVKYKINCVFFFISKDD